MNTTSGAAGRAAVLVSASVVAAMLAAPLALADTTQANLGGQADVGGGQQWTVSELRPSADVIAYSPTGTLWEATATARPAGGGVPMVPGFTARAGAANYPVLWPVPTALGINPAALPAGGSVTGKLYFDVVGPSPVEVVFVADGADAARWVTPPPPPPGSAAAPQAYGAPRAAAPAPATVSPAPAAAQPAPGASAPATPPAAGSSGTPLPAASSQGTPLPAENPTTATAPGAPSTAAAPTTAAAPPAAASQGTPLADDSAAPAPAATTPAPAAAPTTTAVPAG